MSACPETERFAALLRSLKSRSGLSYEALARKSGLSGSSLHRYCRGTSVPQDYGSVHRLATVCGATPEELRTLHRLWALADAARAAASGDGEEGKGEGDEKTRADGRTRSDARTRRDGKEDDARAEREAEERPAAPAPAPARADALASAPDRVDGSALASDRADALASAPDRVDGSALASARADALASAPDRVDGSALASDRADAPAPDPYRSAAPAPAPDRADGSALASARADALASAPDRADGSALASARADAPAPDPYRSAAPAPAPHRADAPASDSDRGAAQTPTPDRFDAPPPAPDRSGRPDTEPSPGPAGRARRHRLRTSVVIAVIVAAVSVSAWVLTNGRSSSGGGRDAGEDRPLFSAGCPPVIAMGEHDECVREVQRLLHAKGADIGVDGDFGPQTLRRVTAFQVLAGLQPNGVVGDPTKKALYTSDVRMSVWPPEKVRERVREVFPETPDKAVAIADCQSFLDPLHILPNTNGTRNWGLFQISDARLQDLGGTPREALDPEWNIQAARKLWSRDHDFGDWPHCERAAEAPRSPTPRHSSTTARPPR